MRFLKPATWFVVATTAAITTIPLTVNATNGYFAHGYGARSKAMAGPNPLSPGQTIDLSMSQFSLQFAWSRRF